MSTSTIRHRAGIAVALPVVVAVLLSGCVPVEGGEQAEDSAQEAAPDMDGGALPEDFPASVPIIDGEITVESAGSGDADGWVVEVESSVDDPLEEAAAELETAGFADDPSISGDGGGAAVYSDGEYEVLLIGQGKTIVYTVTPAQQ